MDNIRYMRSHDDGAFDLIVTSPPYNVGKEYESRLSMDDYLRDQQTVIAEACRLLSQTGSICWQVGNHVTKDREIVPLDCILYPLFKEAGLILRNRIVWTYDHGLHCKHRFSGRYETILWFTRSEYTFNLDPVRVPSKYPDKRHYKGPKKGQLSGNPLGKNPSDVWAIPNVKSNHIEKTDHPCQYPVELVERLVLSLSNPGDKVFDPYVGSGSTMIAALKHDRSAFGCDISQEYVNIAEKRISALQSGVLKTRPMDRIIR